jgi:RNA polymerase sigma-70 factor (ECF subfamily)
VAEAQDARLSTFIAQRAALVRAAAAILGCRIRAEDVVQDCCMRFLADEGAARGALHPAAYLQRMVRNLAFDHLRRQGVENRAHACCAVSCALHRAPRSPEDVTLGRDDLRAACAALAALPERQRRAFALHRIHGLTFREIGEHIGVSTATAHRLVRDALTRLMAALAEEVP